MPEDSSCPADTCEVRIESLAADGLGVGHVGGRALFLPFVVPGELVLARRQNRAGRRLLAKVERLLEASPWRREPPCPVFGRCGGCSLQHIDDGKQLELKTGILLDALRGIAQLTPPEPELVQSPRPLAYRNRGQYPVASLNRRAVTGFFARGTHQVVPVDRCPLHDQRVDQAVREVRAWANHKNISVYDERGHRGWLRHVTARAATGGEQLLVTLVAREPRRVPTGDLLRRLRRRLPGLAGLVCNLQPARSNVIFGARYLVWWGEPFLPETFCQLKLRLSPVSFFQVNAEVAGEMFRRALEFVAGAGGPVVDAFCGAGIGALLAARRGLQAVGIDSDRLAIESARQAARDNRLDGAAFQVGRAERVLPQLLSRDLRPRAFILDPPRSGCAAEVIQAVADGPACRVAYLSCHPGTLARDLRGLADAGFRLADLCALDMFPQTAHLETLALLER